MSESSASTHGTRLFGPLGPGPVTTGEYGRTGRSEEVPMVADGA